MTLILPLLAQLAVGFGGPAELAPVELEPADPFGDASHGCVSGQPATSPLPGETALATASARDKVRGSVAALEGSETHRSSPLPLSPQGVERGSSSVVQGNPDVAEAATAALASVWPDARVRVVRLSPSARAAAPPLRVQFQEPAPKGRVSATVLAETASGWAEAGWAYLDVAVYDTVAVLAADAGRGEAVSVTAERVDVTALRDPLPPNGLAGWTARRSLRAGTPLTARLVEPPAAVESRAPVRVRYRRGAVRVTLDCVSRERGAVGETVRATCDGATHRVLLTAPGQGDWSGTL